MILFWYLLLLFYWSVGSWAKPLVPLARRGSELSVESAVCSEPSASRDNLMFITSSPNGPSRNSPSPPSFLSPRAPTHVATTIPMSSSSIFPLLGYSTLIAIIGFISMRIARWRRKRRPAALELDDVELLPTNTSTLSPRFKDLPVPPPLPESPAPSHMRSRSFSNLPEALVHVHDLTERPKSPIQFGISSPGSRLKSKRSASVGSPLSPNKRRNVIRRPFISDPETEAEAIHSGLQSASTPNTPFPPQTRFGTLVDLSVPPVPVSSPMNPGFGHVLASTHVWAFAPPTASEEVNLIDLHAPERDVSERIPVPIRFEPEQESKFQDEMDSDRVSVPIRYEPEREESREEQDVGYEQDREGAGKSGEEVDIGWEWGFESVTSLSTRLSTQPRPKSEEEEDLVDRASPTAYVQLKPIPITASSSAASTGALSAVSQGEEEVRVEDASTPDPESADRDGENESWSIDRVAGDVEARESGSDSALASESSSSVHLPPSIPRMVVLGADHSSDLITSVVDDAEDNGTLPSFTRDSTSLDSESIARVYISEPDDAGAGTEEHLRAPAVVDANSLSQEEGLLGLSVSLSAAAGASDVAEAGSMISDEVEAEIELTAPVSTDQFDEDNDYNDTHDRYDDEGEEEKEEEKEDELDKDVEVEGKEAEALEAALDVEVEAVTPLTPPPSHEKLVALAAEPVYNGELEELQDQDEEEIEEQKDEQYPDPDLLPLPELADSSSLSAQKDTESAQAPSPTTQVPTPPASPPQLRRPLPRGDRERDVTNNAIRPAWSVRAADAPALGLSTSASTPVLRTKASLPNLSSESAKLSWSGDEMEQEKSQTVILKPQAPSTPAPRTATLPGAFPVDVHPLADVAPVQETGSTSPSSSLESSTTETAAAPSESSTAVAVPKPTRRARQSPIDIALAMQLRPGLGLGADPAWMVRFLMAMFGWFIVLISGSAGDGYVRNPYVGIRRSG